MTELSIEELYELECNLRDQKIDECVELEKELAAYKAMEKMLRDALKDLIREYQYQESIGHIPVGRYEIESAVNAIRALGDST